MSGPSKRRDRLARLSGDVVHSPWLSLAAGLWVLSLADFDWDLAPWLRWAVATDAPWPQQMVLSLALEAVGWAAGTYFAALVLGGLQTRFTWNVASRGTRRVRGEGVVVGLISMAAVTAVCFVLARWTIAAATGIAAWYALTRFALRLLGTTCLVIAAIDLIIMSWTRRRRLALPAADAKKEAESESVPPAVKRRLAELRRELTDS